MSIFLAYVLQVLRSGVGRTHHGHSRNSDRLIHWHSPSKIHPHRLRVTFTSLVVNLNKYMHIEVVLKKHPCGAALLPCLQAWRMSPASHNFCVGTRSRIERKNCRIKIDRGYYGTHSEASLGSTCRTNGVQIVDRKKFFDVDKLRYQA